MLKLLLLFCYSSVCFGSQVMVSPLVARNFSKNEVFTSTVGVENEPFFELTINSGAYQRSSFFGDEETVHFVQFRNKKNEQTKISSKFPLAFVLTPKGDSYVVEESPKNLVLHTVNQFLHVDHNDIELAENGRKLWMHQLVGFHQDVLIFTSLDEFMIDFYHSKQAQVIWFYDASKKFFFYQKPGVGPDDSHFFSKRELRKFRFLQDRGQLLFGFYGREDREEEEEPTGFKLNGTLANLKRFNFTKFRFRLHLPEVKRRASV